MSGRHSLRKRIDAMCKDCTCDELAMGTWRQQVTLCSVTACPLWQVRPTTSRIPESVLKYYGVASDDRVMEHLDRQATESSTPGPVRDDSSEIGPTGAHMEALAVTSAPCPVGHGEDHG
jgi:hypothetical protein